MRGPEINKPKSATAPPATSASCGLQPRPRPGGPSRPSRIAPPKPINQNFTAHDSFRTTLETHKENHPEMQKREHAGAPNAFLPHPPSLASDPVARGRPRPGQRPPPVFFFKDTGPTGTRTLPHHNALPTGAAGALCIGRPAAAAPPRRPGPAEPHRAAEANK